MRILLVFLFSFLSSVWAQEVALAPEVAPVTVPPVKRILLVTDIAPMNFTWEQLGLTKEASFTSPMAEAWRVWINENFMTLIGPSEICHDECRVFLTDWETRPKREIKSAMDPIYGGSSFLRITLNIWRKSGSDLSYDDFNWEGRVVLSDINTKSVYGGVVLQQESKRVMRTDNVPSNSVLASQIYRSPLAAFSQLLKKMNKAPLPSQSTAVTIKGHRRLLEVIELMQLLQTRGTHLGLSCSLTGQQKDLAFILCAYKGEEKSFNDLLSKLKELKSSESYTLVNQITNTEHVIQLVAE